MKFKLRLLLSLLPFADPFADDGEAPFLRRNLRSEINRIFLFFFFFFLKFLEKRSEDILPTRNVEHRVCEEENK